ASRARERPEEPQAGAAAATPNGPPAIRPPRRPSRAQKPTLRESFGGHSSSANIGASWAAGDSLPQCAACGQRCQWACVRESSLRHAHLGAAEYPAAPAVAAAGLLDHLTGGPGSLGDGLQDLHRLRVERPAFAADRRAVGPIPWPI